MPKLLRGPALAACGLALALSARPLQAQIAATATGSGTPDEELVLQYGEGGERLSDVLDLFKNLLALPIDFNAQEVGGVTVRIEGPQHIARAHLRDAFDSLLERHGFWCWDDVTGGSPQIVVRQKTSLRAAAGLAGFTPRVIGLDELQAGPIPRAPLYIVSFQLRYASAITLMTVLASSLDAGAESIRVTDSNMLLVKASRAHLLQVRDVLAAADVPAPDAPATDRMVALEKRLAALELRLAALEAHLAPAAALPGK